MTNVRLVLHSVSYAGLWGQARLPVEAVLDRAVQLGYEAVMLVGKRPHASPGDLDEGARRRLRAALDRRGLRLAAVAGYTDFCGGQDHLGIPMREMQLLYVAELARLASDLDADVVRVFTGYGRSDVPFDTQWAWCVEAIRECARRAADHGVTIGVQNHHDLAVHPDSLLDFLRDVGEPNCKLCFDAWSPALLGCDLGAVARRMAPHTVFTTVADYVARPRYAYDPSLVNYTRQTDALRAVAMGEGFIDYRAFLDGLRAGGYPADGWVAYEMCSALDGGGSEENLDRCARRFVGWMREHGYAPATHERAAAAAGN
ncbi:MAG TPA: sugar phosphate isomerase/epimerase family protein [Chloroflexota bacterium]|nr:sugar phosphate isomerase/epimerase family protein [Chloroflexota bacterium]